MANNPMMSADKTDRTLDRYLEHADELAQTVVNHWGPYAQAGHLDALTPQFMALFDKACRYREAKGTADNRREFNSLTPQVEAAEKEARLAFAKAYKTLDDSAAGSLSPWDKAALDTWRAMKS